MDAIERLDAVEQIKQLKARYFRCMDTKDWDGFAAVFGPDAVMDMSGEMRDQRTEGEGVTRGAGEIAGYGHYHETYEKVAGEWRIKTIALTRLRVDADMP